MVRDKKKFLRKGDGLSKGCDIRYSSSILAGDDGYRKAYREWKCEVHWCMNVLVICYAVKDVLVFQFILQHLLKLALALSRILFCAGEYERERLL